MYVFSFAVFNKLSVVNVDQIFGMADEIAL